MQQIILKKDYSKHDQSYDKSILGQIVTYFNILSKINKTEKAQYEYYIGETYYSVNEQKKALVSYKTSLKDYDKTPSKEDLRAKNMDAVFSCIDSAKFSEKEKRNRDRGLRTGNHLLKRKKKVWGSVDDTTG